MIRPRQVIAGVLMRRAPNNLNPEVERLPVLSIGDRFGLTRIDLSSLIAGIASHFYSLISETREAGHARERRRKIAVTFGQLYVSQTNMRPASPNCLLRSPEYSQIARPIM